MTYPLLCITGQICAGKDQVASILEHEYALQRIGMSAVLTELLEQQGAPVTREALYTLGVSMDPAEKASRLLDSMMGPALLTGIRTPATYAHLQKQTHTVLIAVLSDQETRYQRFLSRKRDIDTCSYEAFLETEVRENQGIMNTQALIEQADITVYNMSTIKKLQEEVLRISWSDYL